MRIIRRVLTIKKSAEFKKISHHNSKFHAKTLILLTSQSPSYCLQDKLNGKNAEDFCRVGYTVSKIVGNAVFRNLAKRRLREAVRELMTKYAKSHMDYVIIAKKEINQADFKKICDDLKFCLKRIHNIKK